MAALGALLAPLAVAEDVVTKTDGGKLRGKVLVDAPEGVTIKTAGGVIFVARDEVAVVDRAKDLARELLDRQAELEKRPSVDGWLKCKDWCEQHGLWVAASDALKHVIKLDPDNEPARTELGYRRLHGQWVTVAEYQTSLGYVQYEGSWITAEDKEKIDQGLVKWSDDEWITRAEADRRQKELDRERQGIPTHPGDRPQGAAPSSDPSPAPGKAPAPGRKARKEDPPHFFEGKLVYTKSRDQIQRALDQIDASAVPPLGKPRNTDWKPLDDASQAAALKRLEQYRFLSDVPIDIEINPDYAVECAAAVKLLELVGHLDHTPPKPPGCPDNLYKVGYQGTSHSNLHQGQSSAATAVDGFMFDSDPSNIDRVGHRRWCLNAAMKQTAFGSSPAGFVAMYSLDNGRTPLPQDAVLYPARGWYPASYMREGAAWSAHLGPQFGRPVPGDVKVIVTPVDANMKKGKPVDIDYLHVDMQGFGYGVACVIFKPRASTAAGSRYWVELQGLKEPNGGDTTLEYMVDLY